MKNDLRTPVRLGVVALAISSEILGLGLAAISVSSIWSQQYSRTDIVLLAVGVFEMVAGVGFFYLQRWAWWWAILNFYIISYFTLLGTYEDLAHFRETGECCGLDKKWGELVIAFIFWPFLCYYLLRARTRNLFGVGSAGAGKEMTPTIQPCKGRILCILLNIVGAFLLVFVPVLYTKPLVMGWPMTYTPVGLTVMGLACLWISSELKRSGSSVA